MTVAELIENLQMCPQGYEVAFESGDAYGSAYMAYVDTLFVKDGIVELKKL